MIFLKVPIKADEFKYIPRYQTAGDAGADLVSSEKHSIAPGAVALVDCGIQIAIPEGWVGLIHPRSGLATKKQLTVVNAPGTIDSGYRGRIMVALINLSEETRVIEEGDRVAQLILQEVAQADFIQVEDLSETERGNNGFGSTGTS